MADHVSFIVVSASGRFFKRGYFSRPKLYGMFSAALIVVLVMAGGFTDYIRLLRKDLHKKHLQTELVLRNQELALQRQQIQKFAYEINQLKDHLIVINRIDRQIRRVAQMDESTDLFGVGGSPPADLNQESAFERKDAALFKEMEYQVGELEKAAVYQENSLNDLWKMVQMRGNFMAYTPTIRPAKGFISSPFGYRESPFTGEHEFHQGLDIADRSGTEVAATAFGRISFAGISEGFGNTVIIEHGHGLTTVYGHLEKIKKKRADRIRRGEVIGIMGNTGRSTGMHLHYEVRLNGVPVNPQKYILD